MDIEHKVNELEIQMVKVVEQLTNINKSQEKISIILEKMTHEHSMFKGWFAALGSVIGVSVYFVSKFLH